MSSREKVVCDSSPLIWLAKVNMLSVLRKLYGEVIIPKTVWVEVSRGESADALVIIEAKDEGWVKIVDGKGNGVSDLIRVSGIHRGEAEAILLARKLGALFVVDNREGSGTARVFGVQSLGTVGVLMLGLAEGLLSLDAFLECLDDMIDLGFWLSVEVYRKAVAEARHIAGTGTGDA